MRAFSLRSGHMNARAPRIVGPKMIPTLRAPALRPFPSPPKAALAGAGTSFVDFYELLGIEDSASSDQIKAAYRSLAKVCHPDRAGDPGHEMCIMLNEAYETLSDPQKRASYDSDLLQWLQDDESGYTGKPLSKWVGFGHKMSKAQPGEDRAVFVDEVACIGCKQCIYIAAGTFRLENEHGRSRVFAQWVNTEDEISAAIESCPVSCIHWVKREDLPALEYVTQNLTERVNVGVMMAQQGGTVPDVWAATTKFMKQREDKEQRRRARARYSPQQQESRQQAAEKIMTEQMGWFGKTLFQSLMGQQGGVGGGRGRDDRDLSRLRRVRREQRQAADYGEAFDALAGFQSQRGTVPLERALVPVRAFYPGGQPQAPSSSNEPRMPQA